MNKNCLWCKGSFSVFPSRVNIAKFCSKKCSFDYKRSLPGKKVKLTCSFCGKVFLKYPSLIESSNVYCSNKCKNNGRTKHIYTCQTCGLTFHRSVKKTVTPHYCSRKCMTIAKRKEWKKDFNCFCLFCNKGMYRSNSSIRNGEGKFCSRICKGLFQEGKNPKDGSTATYPHYYSKAKWRKIRKEILDRDSHKCISCGITSDKKGFLQVNHILPRQLGGLDVPKNLETLCKVCHSKKDHSLLVSLSGDSTATFHKYRFEDFK